MHLLRRKMRKPVDMSVRTYIQHLQRINREELPNLPPFLNTNQLSDDEMIDIFLFGTCLGRGKLKWNVKDSIL